MHGLLCDNSIIDAAWGREPAIIKDSGLASLMPTVNELLETPLLRPPYLFVMSGQKPVAHERYCRGERVVSGGPVEQFVDSDLVAAELGAGAGIKFNRMELWSQQISAIARQFGQARDRTVKVWGFLSPPGEMMFASHRDPAHVVAVQLDGTKEWRLDGPCPDGPWDSLGDVAPITEPMALTLEPGDVLYLPYGFVHSAVAADEYSYHISFALESMTAGSVWSARSSRRESRCAR